MSSSDTADGVRTPMSVKSRVMRFAGVKSLVAVSSSTPGSDNDEKSLSDFCSLGRSCCYYLNKKKDIGIVREEGDMSKYRNLYISSSIPSRPERQQFNGICDYLLVEREESHKLVALRRHIHRL